MKNRISELPSLTAQLKGRAVFGKSVRVAFLGCLVALSMAAQKCDSETLFKSNFDSTAVNNPPSTNQAVGTATFFGVPGSVLVVPAPPDAAPPAKWLRIIQSNNPHSSHFHGRLKRKPGLGTYVVRPLWSSPMVIPGLSRLSLKTSTTRDSWVSNSCPTAAFAL
jgi:hypothetical protein